MYNTILNMNTAFLLTTKNVYDIPIYYTFYNDGDFQFKYLSILHFRWIVFIVLCVLKHYT